MNDERSLRITVLKKKRTRTYLIPRGAWYEGEEGFIEQHNSAWREKGLGITKKTAQKGVGFEYCCGEEKKGEKVGQDEPKHNVLSHLP